MREKEYVLYFKGINKYGHEHTIKLVSLGLKKLDEYTADFSDFKELYYSLNHDIKTFMGELKPYEKLIDYSLDAHPERSKEHFAKQLKSLNTAVYVKDFKVKEILEVEKYDKQLENYTFKTIFE